MILGFKEQFRAPILAGTKIHTIRADKHDRWKPGKPIQMATGVRTKHYQCFREDSCKSIQTLRITCDKDGISEVFIDDHEIPGHRFDLVQTLARNDGFTWVIDFINFISKLSDRRCYDFGKREICLKIIHWTDFKYEFN